MPSFSIVYKIILEIFARILYNYSMCKTQKENTEVSL